MRTDIKMSDSESSKSDVNMLLPAKSRAIYQIGYQKFINWCYENRIKDYSENTLLSYFTEQATVLKIRGSTMWRQFFMIKALLNINHGIDISEYSRLYAYLKKKKKDNVPRKPKTFTKEQLDTFLFKAPDSKYLAIKIALIIGITGACRCEEMVRLKADDIEDFGSSLCVKIHGNQSNKSRAFTIVGENFINIYRKYASSRPRTIEEPRFFLKYTNGKCYGSVMGINKIGSMPREVACFLKLPNWKEYTGHSFRYTPSTWLVDERTNNYITEKDLLVNSNVRGSIVNDAEYENSIEDQEQTSSFLTSLHEEIDIKVEPEEDIKNEDLEDEFHDETEELEEECVRPQELTEISEPVTEKQTAVSKKIKRRTNFHRKPIFVKNNKSVIREDEFDVYGKHIAMQLRQLPLEVSIACQNQIQDVIAKARLKVLNHEKEVSDTTDVFSSLGSYVSKRLRTMEPKQQIMAEHLMLKVVTKGNLNKLSENTVLVNKNKDNNEDTWSNHLPLLRAISCDDVSNASTTSDTNKPNTNPPNEPAIQTTTLACKSKTNGNNSNTDTPKIEKNLRNRSSTIVSPRTSSNKKRKRTQIETSNLNEPEKLLHLTTSEDIDQQEELNLKELARLSPVFISLNPLQNEIINQSDSENSLEPPKRRLPDTELR